MRNAPAIAILGGGPVGLYCWMACNTLGLKAHVYTKTEVKNIPGAFWLREVPPQFEWMSQEQIKVFSSGSADEYMRKQWGEAFANHPSSFPTEPTVELGYDPMKVIPEMYSMVRNNQSLIISGNISDSFSERIAEDYDLTFQTFPTEESRLEYKDYIVSMMIVYYKNSYYNGHSVQYIGDKDSMYTRISNLWGYTSFEVARGQMPTLEFNNNDVQYVQKPDTRPNCPEWPLFRVPHPKIILIGRHATWRRKELTHEAYHQALNVLKSRGF